MADGTEITNYYPNDIRADYNANRRIIIMVKECASIKDGADTMLKEIEKTAADAQKSLSSSKDKSKTPTAFDSIREKARNSKKISNLGTVYGVALPLPNEFSENQNHQWSTTEGFISGKLSSMVGSGVNKVLGEIANTSGFKKALVNPGYFQDYNGTNPRVFNFTWDFVPNNVDEAKNLISILYNLKKYCLPTSTLNGVALLSPYMFDIQIENSYLNALINMNNVVCENISINYNASGAVQFFSDGIPKYITLQMTFNERSTVTADYF